MQCPLKFTASDEEDDWSSLLESARKDVECFFGVLKRRFAILRDSIEYQSKDVIDNAFYCCCILHNMLQAYDSRDEWAVVLDEVAAGGIELDDAMLLNAMEVDSDDEEDEEGAEAYRTLQQKLITHLAAARAQGLPIWLRGL